MKTIVDHAKSTSSKKIYNNKALQFGNDYNMKISSTEPYNPQGKGTIEAKMKFLDNIFLYDRRLRDWKELDNIIQNIEDEANKSIRKTEKLNHLPKEKIRKNYIEKREQLTVARSSTILYKKTRYSVKTSYIWQKCWIKEQNSYLCIYDLYGLLIRKHKLTQKQNCYHLKDFKTIITQPKYIKYKKDNETVEEFVIAQFKRLGGNWHGTKNY